MTVRPAVVVNPSLGLRVRKNADNASSMELTTGIHDSRTNMANSLMLAVICNVSLHSEALPKTPGNGFQIEGNL